MALNTRIIEVSFGAKIASIITNAVMASLSLEA